MAHAEQCTREVEECSSTSHVKRSLRDYTTLILNADYTPMDTWPPSIESAIDAIKMVLRGRADIVDAWPDAFCRSTSVTLPIPKVVVIREFAPVYGDPKFCRASILLRDRYCCQYCGGRFESKDLTYDHVIPRDRGGQTTWENVLTACMDCNNAKRNTLPNYSGRKRVKGGDGTFRPLKMPRRPTRAELMRAGLELLPDQVIADFGSFLYWNVELKA
jgi:5-methylcytosine-specific restriction endonuclease McrA